MELFISSDYVKITKITKNKMKCNNHSQVYNISSLNKTTVIANKPEQK